LNFAEGHPSAGRFQADGRNVVFATSCYVEPDLQRDDAAYRLRPVDVRVLVSGDYVLTLHRESVSLPELLAPYIPEGRSEQYAVYAVLDAMLASSFDALNEVEETLDSLAVMSSDLRSGRLRMATLRTSSSWLSGMRRRAAPQRSLFERLGV
jgi:Mg2+ and Co2+ transporter CorA